MLKIIDVADIEIGNRLRTTDKGWVEFLSTSIMQAGLINPITVRHIDVGGEDAYILIAGNHRLEAVMLLGEKTIKATIADTDDIGARISEISENLYRRELNELDRCASLAELKNLYETLHPDTKHGGDRRSEKSSRQVGDLKFSKQAAQSTGLSNRTIERAVKRYNALTPATRELIKNTDLTDNGVWLDQLGAIENSDHQYNTAQRFILGRNNGEKIKSIIQASNMLLGTPNVDDDSIAVEQADGTDDIRVQAIADTFTGLNKKQQKACFELMMRQAPIQIIVALGEQGWRKEIEEVAV